MHCCPDAVSHVFSVVTQPTTAYKNPIACHRFAYVSSTRRTFARIAAFQWFLTAFSVRPSSLRVMRAQWLPRMECHLHSSSSSATSQEPFLLLGLQQPAHDITGCKQSCGGRSCSADNWFVKLTQLSKSVQHCKLENTSTRCCCLQKDTTHCALTQVKTSALHVAGSLHMVNPSLPTLLPCPAGNVFGDL